MQPLPTGGAPLRAFLAAPVEVEAQTFQSSSPRINRFMTRLLRSPLHWLASHRVALLSVVGRKTGQVYEFPVRYALSGQTVTIAARKLSRWWLNLAGGADVMLLIQGKQLPGTATLATDDLSVAAALRSLSPRSKPERIAARLPWRVAVVITLNAGSNTFN